MKKIFRGFTFIPLFALYSISLDAQSRDSVLTFQEVKARLIKKNLALLAAYYDIDIAKAGIIQARLWNNPYFVFNGDLYSNETNEYFHFRNQHLLQVEQTFSIAGKHTNTVKLARLGAEMAERQMEDVLRSLLYEAGNLYNDLASIQEKVHLFEQVMAGYEKLIEATKSQLEVGAISVTEAIRLESEYLAVKTESLSNRNEQEKTLSELRTLLRMPQDTVFRVEQRVPMVLPSLEVNSLMEEATASRPDLQLSRKNMDWQKRNLRLQRSLGVPDLKFAYQPRDRGSNYVRPYQGFNVEFSIPLFNRNQGEIKSAELNLTKSGLEFNQLENQVRNEVTSAYNRYINAKSGLVNYTPELLTRLNRLNESTNENFRKRNISLLQFIDQQRIYIQTNIQLIELRQQFLGTVNDLHFATGKTLIDF
jgi:cobalt-zinc-cadmium efflux system outer membrane protein